MHARLDLDAVTVAEQPRTPYHATQSGSEAVCDWKQATETVTLYIPVRAGTASRAMAVQIKPQRLHVAYRGEGAPTLIEAELGGRCDPDESEWRVSNGELVIELRKAQWREWVVPLTPTGDGLHAGTEPAGATGAPAAPPARAPPMVTSYKPPAAPRGVAGAAAQTGGPSLGAKYTEWDRFDQASLGPRLLLPTSPNPLPHLAPNHPPNPASQGAQASQGGPGCSD